MVKTVTQTIWMLWLGVMLTLSQSFASSAVAACLAGSVTQPKCACKMGCGCCVKPNHKESNSIPAPVANAQPRVWDGVVLVAVFQLALPVASDRDFILPEFSFAPTSRVAIFTRDCSYLI